MLGLRRIATAIPKINSTLANDVKYLSTQAQPEKKKLKMYETEKVVKYVHHIPQPNPEQKRTGNTAPKEGNADYVPNPLGRFYQEAVHKGRMGNKIGLGDLRKIFLQCEKPEDIRYATGIVNLLQKKGDDFSEDINMHYVNACIKFDRVDILITEFSERKYRIGAWSNEKSIEQIVTALESKGEASRFLPVLHTLAPKGVRMKESSIRTVVSAAALVGDSVEYQKALWSARMVLSEDIVSRCEKDFPLQEPVVVEEVVKEFSEVVEGETPAVPV